MPRPLVRRLRLLAPCLAWLIAAFAQAAPIPPGMEGDVGALVREPGLPEGWSIGEVRILPTGIEIELAGPAPERLVLRGRGVEDPAGRLVGRTKSFSLWRLPPDAPEAPATAFLATLAARDDGTFWTKAAERAPPTGASARARDLGAADELRRALTWLATLALLGFALFRAEKRVIAAGLAVGLVALAVRFSVPAPAPMHANGHGIAELRGLAGWPGHDVFEPEADRYGVAYRQLLRTVLAPLHGGAEAVFRFAGIAGAFGAVAAFALAYALGAGLAGASLAGLAVALFPAHVWLSDSESPMPLAGAWWLAGTAAFVAAMRASGRDRHLLAWAGALSLGCAAELGLTTLALPVASLALVVAVTPIAELKARPTAWIGPLLVLALTMALHVHALGPVFAESQARSSELPQSLDRLLHGGLLPATAELAAGLAIVALAGLVFAVRRHPRAVAGLVLMLAIALIPAVIVNVALTDRVRYQSVPLTVLGVLAGLALAGRRAPGAMLAGLVLLVAEVPGLMTLARTKTLETQGWELLRHAPLPPGAMIRVPQRRLGGVIAEFPEYLWPDRPVEVTSRALPRAGPCFVWIGPACWSFTREELASGILERTSRFDDQPIRPECAELVTAMSSGPPLTSVRADVPWRDDEFHRIVNEHPLIGLFPCR